jgi:hypothetical protein
MKDLTKIENTELQNKIFRLYLLELFFART